MSSMLGRMNNIEEETALDIQESPNHFPFLKLPAEIKNEIYRLLLLTQMVSTDSPRVRPRREMPDDGANGVAPIAPVEVAIGTVRCLSWRTYRLGYQVSILRANRQIYREAWNLFHLENYWVLVRVNKAGFGAEMKNSGFPVATARDISRHVKFPVLKVGVIFPSLEEQNQSDTFVMATAHLKQLVRALWTAQGASEMVLTITIQPRLTNKSPAEEILLEPMSKLRSIRTITISGVSSRKPVDQLSRAITKSIGINQTFAELTADIKSLQECIKARKWGGAMDMVEKYSLLMHDCQTVYGKRFLGCEPGINIHTSIRRSEAAKEIMVAGAKALAEVALHRDQHDSTIRFASRALVLISSQSILQLQPVPNPAVPAPAPFSVVLTPNNPPASITNTVLYNDHTKCFLHLVRARAYMELQQPAPALWNINKAGELQPNSTLLSLVHRAWNARYGPVPTVLPPAPPPPIPRYSSLIAAFADTVEDLDWSELVS